MKNLHYIAIEGVIGVGKTSLARLLAERFHGQLLPERAEENPFLQDFYSNPGQYAFLTQLNFLFLRYEQLQQIQQQDLFHQMVISDYLFAKDRIFASVTLGERELALYDRISALLVKDIPEPDLIIFLQASTRQLMERIRRRNLPYEEAITEDYLRLLNEAYNQYFFQITPRALLVINTMDLDFVRNPADFDALVEQIQQPFAGTRYFNSKTTRG